MLLHLMVTMPRQQHALAALEQLLGPLASIETRADWAAQHRPLNALEHAGHLRNFKHKLTSWSKQGKGDEPAAAAAAAAGGLSGTDSGDSAVREAGGGDGARGI